MGISRANLFKDLLPKLNGAFAGEYEALKIDQIIHNEAVKQKQKELEHLIQQAGKTFRYDVKVAQIIANEEQSVKRRKELEDAV